MLVFPINILTLECNVNEHDVWYLLRNINDDEEACIGVWCSLGRMHISRMDGYRGYVVSVVNRHNIRKWTERVRNDPCGCNIICTRRPTFSSARYDSEMFEAVTKILHMYDQTIQEAATIVIQKNVRGWLSRRVYSRKRMLLLSELSVLPASFVHPSFPGGTVYRRAKDHFHTLNS